MDKILITLFKDEIANAILNSQDKLNPNKDAYIDKDELKGVLDFFGVDDVSKLLKSNPSVFDKQESNSKQQTNEDTVEISNNNTTGDTEGNSSGNQTSENDAISTYGTAAHELDSKFRASLSMHTEGTQYTQQMEALEREKNLKLANNQDATDVIHKIAAHEDLVLDYMREHPGTDKKQLVVREIIYGKNGEKKAVMSQSFSLDGNNAFDSKDIMAGDTSGDNKQDNVTNGNENESGEEGSSSYDDNKSNSASAEVSYNIDFRTLNTNSQGNWHLKATVNASSSNCDLHGACQYTRALNNGGVLNFSANLRETIEEQNNIGSAGASFDFRKDNISAGAFAMHMSQETDGKTSRENSFQMYGRYSKTFLMSAGIDTHDDNKYYFAKGILEGEKEFEDIGLTIRGGVGGEYGGYDYSADNASGQEIKLRVKGAISFKSKDLDADVVGNLTMSRIKTTVSGSSGTAKTTIGSLTGNISTKNIDLTTTLSAIGVNSDKSMQEIMRTAYSSEASSNTDTPDSTYTTVPSVIDNDKISVTASVQIGIKNVFGKNVMPILKFNVGNFEGAAKNVGVGVIVTP